MNRQQSTLLNTAHNVQAFLESEATVIGPSVASARRNFDDAVARLDSLAARQGRSKIDSRGATKRLTAVRAVLRNNHMSAVRQTARMALLDVPELGTLTATTRNLSDPRLVAAAHAMADAAEPYTSVFTQAGMPDDFVARVRSAADAVTQVGTSRNQAALDVRAATANIRAQEGRVRKLLKLLNALVVPRLGTDAELLAKWQTVRAIDHQREIVPVPASVVSPLPDTADAGATPADTPPAQ